MEWQVSLGGSDIDELNDINASHDGGIIGVGRTFSTDGDISINKGASDLWVIKLSSSGNMVWEKTYGGSGHEEAFSIIPTNDNGFIIGGYTSSNDGDVAFTNGGNDYWIIKIDSSGNLMWEKTFGGFNGEKIKSIKQTYDNGYIMAGRTESVNGDVTISYGNGDYWIVKIDSIGNLQWQKSLGGSSSDFAEAIYQVSDSGFIVNGYSLSNNIDVTGNNGWYDYWVVKLDINGNIQWQKCYGGTGGDFGYDLSFTTDGGYILAGYSDSNDGDVSGNHGIYDLWVIKIDSIGNLIWQKCLGGTAYEHWTSRIQSFNNGYHVLSIQSNSIDGDVSGNHGGGDYWIIIIDENGNTLWQNSYGGSSNDYINAINVLDDGRIILGGSVLSNDGDITINNGSYDWWILKITPNINYIVGATFIDSNNNNIQDLNEPSLINKTITETNTGRFAISYANGSYDLSVLDTGNFSVSPSPLLHYTAVPATHSAYFFAMNQTDSLNDFAFQPNGVINDLQITINPVGAFRPGFNAHYNIHYKNVGTTSLSGSVIFKQDNILTYVSSPTTPTSVTPDSIVWNIPTLNPFDEGNILVTVNVSTGAVLGSSVNSIARIEPVAGDAIPADNESTWPVTVTGSYDPNDILVNRETVTTTELISPPYLDYLIRFQNTGTDTAFTVKIKNPLPINAQLNTFEFLEASHPIQLNYSNAEQLMWFQFDNILLPDSNTNELLSHGYVRYRIKPKSTLTSGDSILNTASIFFDFNAPIYTNTAVTEIVLGTSVLGIKNNFDFKIYPNPSTGEVSISFTLKEEKEIKIELYNSLGQIVKTISKHKFTAGINQINFSTENISKGIYHIKFSVDDEVVTRKLVKW